jgi:hypothetical protein
VDLTGFVWLQVAGHKSRVPPGTGSFQRNLVRPQSTPCTPDANDWIMLPKSIAIAGAASP